ncbi:MAG TPA: TetR family transcriptional regulator [Solirubrobacteraceae bacterium]|nr:TetR family transcriptional regulator [Solirubrobacteraceae bacterium]
MSSLGAAKNGRRRLTQPERSAATRLALLDSTIECLAELGYDHATTTEISERAGLSRGAHLHHYQTRATLLAAAAQLLAQRAQTDLERAVAALPTGAGRAEAALDMVWELFNGPLFLAMLELSVHARTDPELRECLDPIERVVGHHSKRWLRVAFTGDGEDRSVDDVITMALAVSRGLATVPILEPDRSLKRAWSRCREQMMALIAAR